MVPSHGGSTGSRDTDPGSSMSTEECDSGLQHTAKGVTHVGLLRVGAARHVIAALAPGQVLMYRENGEKAWTCICSFVVRHKCFCAFIHMFWSASSPTRAMCCIQSSLYAVLKWQMGPLMLRQAAYMPDLG